MKKHIKKLNRNNMGYNLDIVCWESEETADDENSQKARETVKIYAEKRWGVTNSNISITEYGKPYFQYESDVKFNISHTDGMTVMVICKKEVGVDIEKIRPMSSKLIHRYYSENEKGELSQVSDNRELKIKKETEIWTRKEAYCKCIGSGITKSALSWDSYDSKEVTLFSLLYMDYVITVCIQL